MINFCAEIVDIYIHDVGQALEPEVPDVLNDHSTGNGATGIAHQILQHRVFTLGEVDLLAAAGHHVPHTVQLKVFHAELVQKFRGTAEKSVDPGQQLFKRKRLYQVIIGAGLQAAHAIHIILARAEQQNGHVGPGFPQFSQDGQTVQFRKVPVENDCVVINLSGQLETFFAIPGLINGKVVRFETLHQCTCYFRLILNNQNTQSPPPASVEELPSHFKW